MSDARWRTKAAKMRAAKRAKSLGDEELEQSSNQQTTPEVPEGQPAEFGQGNQQATSEVSEEQSASFLNQPATSQGEMEAYFAIGNCGSDDEEEVAPGQEKDLEEDPDGSMEEEHECSDAQELFDEWMLSLTQNHRKMVSVVLFESFCTRQGMSKMNALRKRLASAYREGHQAGMEVKMALKQYKSHRRIFMSLYETELLYIHCSIFEVYAL